MIFRQTRQFFVSLLAALVLISPAAAQIENLSAKLITQKTDAEIEKILVNRSENELKSFCDDLIKQSDQPDLKSDFPNRVRGLLLATETARRINYGQGEMKALFGLGVAYYQNNQFSVSLDYALRSLAVAEKTGDRKFQATTLAAIANGYRSRTEYAKSLEYYNRALVVYEELNDKFSTSVLNGIGAVNMLLGDYTAAAKAHRRALELAEKNEFEEGIYDSLFHLAIINRLRGNYGDALRLYHEARERSEKLGLKYPDAFPSATVLRHIGGAYFLQGNLRLALDYGNQALVLDERRKDLLGKAYSLQFTAIVRVAEKKYAEALTLAEQTVPMYEKLADNEGLARSLALLGNIYLSIGENEKSLEVLRRALLLREASGSRDGVAIARIAMAKVFLAQAKYPDALALAEKAAESVRENGNRELLWQAQVIIGQIYLANNDCDRTREAFDAAIATIESLRGEIVGGASENSLFFAERVKPYQLLAAMFAGQNNFAESFEYAERAKARVLLDSLRFGRNHQTAAMTGAEKQEENILRSSVTSLNAQISKLSTAAKMDDRQNLPELKKKLEEARTALARFQTNLYAVHPELRIKRGAVKPVDAPEAGNLIDDDGALLEYAVLDNEVLLFVFTKSDNGAAEFKTYRINVGRDDLTKHISRFRKSLAERNILFSRDSRALYDLLLRPAEQQLKGKKSLTIVPDDGLWELPFQALQPAENHYVLDDASVAYVPSLTILRELRDVDSVPKYSAAKPSLLAFGNPTGTTASKNFAALPEAEKQTLTLGNLYGAAKSRVFNRGSADESVFKREAAKEFSILHLATHGILDNSSPLNSYVLLAPNEAAGEDGRLEAWEILEMNLNSDLVFLSACETARGQARSGEGLIGLAWSLMVAGARNVAVSQWKVESSSTTDLTVEFYKNLKLSNGEKKAEALRRAELKLRRNALTAHPFYWAGFVLIGEGR